LGLEKFATLSSGIAIDNSHLIRRAERRVKKLQKQPSKRRKGSTGAARIYARGDRHFGPAWAMPVRGDVGL